MKSLEELIDSKEKELKRRGVYKLHWMDGRKPRQICRLVGADPKGILYIGCTIKRGLIQRLNNIATAFDKQNTQMHTLGIRLHHKPLKGLLKMENIRVTYQLTDNAKDLEKELITKYLKKYGEEPPLNSKLLNPFIQSNKTKKLKP